MNAYNVFLTIVRYFAFSSFLQTLSVQQNTLFSLTTPDRNNIRRRLSGPQGSEFQINTYTSLDQDNPAIAPLSDGGFVVVWSSSGQDGSGDGVYGQRYLATGIAAGSEFRINTYTTGSQTTPAVATLSDGSFVVTWVSDNQDGSSTGIYAQRYTANGVASGGEFRVNTYTLYGQTNPAVAALGDGGFVVTWVSDNQDGSSTGIYAQRYTSNGAASGSEFRVNTYTMNSQTTPAVAALSDGGFVIAWASYAQDGSYDGVYGQCYSASGTANGGEFRANTYTTNSQTSPAVAALNDGGFVITWSSYGQNGLSDGVYGQRYAASRAQAGVEFRVNTHVGNSQVYSTVAGFVNGGFIVTWASYGDGYYYGVYGQYYAASGSQSYGEFQINTYVFDNQWHSTIAILADAGFVVAWESYGQDVSTYASYGVYGQRFDANGNKIAVQVTAKPTLSPSLRPTFLATPFPINTPTVMPSVYPTWVPTKLPSSQPIVEPSYQPSFMPSLLPSEVPTFYPSDVPTPAPSNVPTVGPSHVPTIDPSYRPTVFPSAYPAELPTEVPSQSPTALPSEVIASTVMPSLSSTEALTLARIQFPTNIPSVCPSILSTQSLNPSLKPKAESSQIPPWLILAILINSVLVIACCVAMLVCFRLRNNIASRLNAYFMLSVEDSHLSQVYPTSEIVSVEDLNLSQVFPESELNSMVSYNIPLIPFSELEIELETQGELGRSNLAVVNKARWRNRQVVAVKRSLSLENHEMIFREIAILFRLNHNHIVSFFGQAFSPGYHNHPMIVMEYCPGGTLRSYLQRILISSSLIPWSLHFRMAYELTQALAYIHEKGMIHRDIKSLNVLLDAQQHIKLCDFGMTHARQETLLDTQSHGPENNIAGTYRWMAPEFFQRPAVPMSRQSDIWSLGMVFFELVSLCIPFHGALHRDQVIAWILNGTGEQIPRDCEMQYPGFARIMSDCWKERGQRPSAERLVERIFELPRMTA